MDLLGPFQTLETSQLKKRAAGLDFFHPGRLQFPAVRPLQSFVAVQLISTVPPQGWELASRVPLASVREVKVPLTVAERPAWSECDQTKEPSRI